MLLEDLLEQEKREQEKQSLSNSQDIPSSTTSNVGEAESNALLSDHDFERLKADVFNVGGIGMNANTTRQVQGNLL